MSAPRGGADAAVGVTQALAVLLVHLCERGSQPAVSLSEPAPYTKSHLSGWQVTGTLAHNLFSTINFLIHSFILHLGTHALLFLLPLPPQC